MIAFACAIRIECLLSPKFKRNCDLNITKNRRYQALIVVFVSILLVFILKWTAPEKTPEMKPLPKARVELFSVHKKDIESGETLLGRLIPIRRAQLRFELSGLVKGRLVEPGSRVDNNSILLKLDDGDHRNLASDASAQLKVERAAVNRDKRLLELASQNRLLQEKEVKRLQRLVKKSLTSVSRLDGARQQLSKLKLEEAQLQYSVDSAAARLDIRLSDVEKAQRNVKRCDLLSPWAGVVNQVNVQEGDYVTPTQVVLEIIDDSTLEFLLNVRGEIAHQLKKNAAVDVKVNGDSVSGYIVAIQTDPDPTTFTHEIRVRLPDNTGYPGQLVEARLTLPAMKQVMFVPVTALVYESDNYFVMTYNDGKLSKKEIKVAARVGNEQVVASGLSVGDSIVMRDVASLSSGQMVEVLQSPVVRK